MCSEPVMSALERLGCGELLADGHEAGHFGFGDLDFLASPVGKAQVGDEEILGILRLGIRDNGAHHALLSCKYRKKFVSAVAKQSKPDTIMGKPCCNAPWRRPLYRS